MGKHLCLSHFSIKLQATHATLLKKDSNTGAFQQILQNFKEHLFHRTPPVAASVPKYTINITEKKKQKKKKKEKYFLDF